MTEAPRAAAKPASFAWPTGGAEPVVLTEEPLARFAEFEGQFQAVVAEMRRRGVTCDREYVERLRAEVNALR